MECFYHPGRVAVNTCSKCEQPVCQECNYVTGSHPICHNCLDKPFPTPKVDVSTQPEKSELVGTTNRDYHPQVDAAAFCSKCQKPIRDQRIMLDGKVYCVSCSKKRNRPILTIFLVSLGFSLFVLIIKIPEIVSTGVVPRDISEVTIGIPIFILGLCIWGIIRLIRPTKNRLENTKRQQIKNSILPKAGHSAEGWAMISWKYMEAGEFKAAEKAARTAVSLAPDVAELHFALSTIYYSALANYKGTMSVDEFSTLLGPDLSEQLRHNEPSLFASEGQPPEELTLEVLECSYEYARQMVETHAMETMRLSKNEELRRAANAQIVHLRMMDNM